jgi:hypothetical protein
LPLVDVANNLESSLGAVLVNFAVLNCLKISLSRVAQNVECVISGKCDKLATLRPENAVWFDFYPSD